MKIQRTSNYAIMPIVAIIDPQLSLKAKAVYALIQATNMTSLSKLEALSVDGIKSLRAAYNELKTAGYITDNTINILNSQNCPKGTISNGLTGVGVGPKGISDIIYNTNIYNTSNKSAPKFTKKDMELAQLLEQFIQTNYDFMKKPKSLDKWAGDINKIHRLDNREYEIIEAVINWCQTDSFWKQNIQSGASLRKQFDKLLIGAKSMIQVDQENKGVTL